MEEVVSSLVPTTGDNNEELCQACHCPGPITIVNEQQALPWGEHAVDCRELRLCSKCAEIHKMNLDAAWHDYYSGLC